MKIFTYLLWLFLLLVVLAVGFVLWLLFVQSGRDFLVRQVNGYTSQLATPVVLGRIEGNVFRDFTLDSLTVADGYGVWLTVDKARLVWTPLALLDGTRPFERLDVAKVGMVRLPSIITPQVEETPEEHAVNPLEYLVYVPKELVVEDAVVEAAVTGMRHRLRAEISSLGVTQGVSVSTLEGPVTSVSGTVTLGKVDAVSVDMVVQEAPKGLLGGLLKLPGDAGISATLVGGLEQQMVRVALADVTAGQSRMVVRGEGTLDGDGVSGTVSVRSGDLSEWQRLTGMPLRGAVQAAADVRGNLGALGLNVLVSETSVWVSGTGVTGLGGHVSGTVNVKDAVLPFAADVAAHGNLNGVAEGVYPLTVAATANGTQAVFDVSGTAAMARKGERADVRVGAHVEVSPLAVAGTVDGRWVKGRTTFTANGKGSGNLVKVVLDALRIEGPGTVVSASGVVDMDKLVADGSALVKVRDLGAVAGMVGVNLKGSVDANVVAKNVNGVQQADAAVQAFHVDYAPYRAVLKQPARLVWDGTTGSLSPFVLETMGGTVRAQGRLSEARVDAMVDVRGVDVRQLLDNDVVEGVLNVSVRATGNPAAPVVTADGSMDGKSGAYPLSMKAQGDWRGERLSLKVSSKSGDITGADATVVLGGKLSLLPFEMGIGPASTLRGNVSLNTDLKMLNPLLWTSRQVVEGHVNGQATLGGTLDAPQVNGRFVLANGRYDQSTSGVCLRGVAAEVIASRDLVEIKSLTSQDKDKGLLQGSGRLSLQGDMPLAANIDLQDLQLFCGGLATGKVSGKVGVQGLLYDHTVRGDLLVGPLAVQLPGASRDTDIPQLEVVRVKADDGKESRPVLTHLDINVDAPQQVYVRGRGMDAEFGGKIAVSGLATDPVLRGDLTALRGRFTLLDRVLQLADTKVHFEGPMPPSPYLDVKATTTAQGTTINLTVTGSAMKPVLGLTSDPALPQDEVLALLLFGRRLSNISPFEALKLAQATRVLAGLDGGEPTILEKARRTLGVDTLDIGTGQEAGDVTVTTGKYLTDKVYLSVQQGVEPEDREFKTELELTPSVNGNTTVDGEGNQSFGLEWKKDY